MQKNKYKVDRDKIWIGHVVIIDQVFRHEKECNTFFTQLGKLDVTAYTSLRSMLFRVNNEGLAQDLLYDSPNYPILNITNDEICLNLIKRSIAIREAFSLEELLKYFRYDEKLTLRDIIRIRKTFFTGIFAKDNCELFGWKEILPEDETFYDYEELSDNEIENQRSRYHEGWDKDHRSFVGITECVLPREYWDILDDRGDKSYIDAKILHESRNAFKPHKDEGRIRKLKSLK